MKKSFVSGIVILTALFVFTGNSAFAQNQQIQLPSAGLTPESPFYFLDRLGESLQRFFTFNPESKARLEITFAAERVAEIKVILESKGVQAKGIEVAQNLLNDSLTRTTAILVEQKNEGKNVSALAKELDEKFAGPKNVLEQTFKDQKQTLETKEDELKAKIKEARKAGDTALLESLVKQLGEVKAQKELLEQKEDEQGQDLDEQEEALEEQMSAKDEVEKKIRETGKEKTEMIDDAKEEGLDIPAEAFAQFDNLLSQAKAALDNGNYDEAKQLAKQAEKSLEEVDKNIENLKNAKENEQGLKEEVEDVQGEAEEKLKEADKESAEKIKEEIKQKEEALKEEREKAEKEVKRTEERLQKPESKSEEQKQEPEEER